MFKKKPQIKTLSPLRSSDRRRTADQIIKDYQLDIQAPEGDDAEAKAAATAAHTALRNFLLPDNALSAKFVTTHGPQLKQVTGTVFVGSHGSGEQRVLWVKIEERLYPSVYTLWKNPGILPLVHTPSVVVQKIQGGADLMTPGLAGPPFASKKAVKGAVVAVASLEAPTVPMAVGTCEIDISALQTTRNAKGCAVEIFHWAGDELWDWSTSGKAGRPPPDSIDGWETEEFIAFMARFNGLEVDDKDEADVEGGVPLPSQDDKSSDERGRHDEQNRLVEVVDLDSLEMTTQEIDKAFHSAFLFAVHQLRGTGAPPKYGLDFPLSQSTFISTLVLPFLPAHTQKQADQLVIKKTSWKNARKFIKSLEKEKLLLCREKPSNEVDVWGIDFDDRAFTEFVPYKLPKQTTNGTSEGVTTEEAKDQPADESIGQRLKKTELYKARDGLAPLFKDSNASLKSFHTAADLRSLLVTYIESSSLTNPTNKRLVNLDPFLSNTFFNASFPADAEALARGSAPRDALVDRLLAACAPYYAILRNDDTLESVKPRAGAAPRITTTVETRGGNKRVTRVGGLEPYHVGPQALAEELRKTCAGSAGTEPAKGGKGLEVTVQGPQTQAVLEALEKRGVRSQWVDVVDKTKKKK